jgi:hypothetical protein
MKAAGRVLLLGWLSAALVVLGIDGRLPEFLAGAGCGSLLLLGAGGLVRQLAPPRYNRPSVPECYRVADDLRQPSPRWWPRPSRTPSPGAVGADGPDRCRAAHHAGR